MFYVSNSLTFILPEVGDFSSDVFNELSAAFFSLPMFIKINFIKLLKLEHSSK